MDHWLIRQVTSELAVKLARYRCRVAYNQSNPALDGLPSVTILHPGRRKAPYVPVAMLVATLQDLYLCHTPKMGAIGLDGHPTWNGDWQQIRHFEYADPGFEDQILECVHQLLQHKPSGI